ncbi:MAG: 3'-5' exonuclease [Candidatus Peregrinibacteria bacterium]
MRLIPFPELIRRYFSGESFVVFDTETTGLNTFHDDIIEIAGITWQHHQEPQTFQELIRVNPNKITQGAWEVHQIPLEEIKAARLPSQVLKDFMEFAQDRVLIAHNAKFDYDILNSNLVRNGLKPYQNDQAVCTVNYAREQLIPAKLVDLASHYKIELKNRTLHRATDDAIVLIEILDHMMKEHEPAEMQYSLIL